MLHDKRAVAALSAEPWALKVLTVLYVPDFLICDPDCLICTLTVLCLALTVLYLAMTVLYLDLTVLYVPSLHEKRAVAALSAEPWALKLQQLDIYI